MNSPRVQTNSGVGAGMLKYFKALAEGPRERTGCALVRGSVALRVRAERLDRSLRGQWLVHLTGRSARFRDRFLLDGQKRPTVSAREGPSERPNMASSVSSSRCLPRVSCDGICAQPVIGLRAFDSRWTRYKHGCRGLRWIFNQCKHTLLSMTDDPFDVWLCLLKTPYSFQLLMLAPFADRLPADAVHVDSSDHPTVDALSRSAATRGSRLAPPALGPPAITCPLDPTRPALVGLVVADLEGLAISCRHRPT
jgi:hypothetical protein